MASTRHMPAAIGPSRAGRRRAAAGRGRRAMPESWRSALGAAVWTGLILAARLLLAPIEHADPNVHIGFPPLVGMWDPRLGAGLGLAPALLLGAAAIAWAPRLATTLRWRRLLAASYGAALAWPLALASADGLHAVVAPLELRYDSLAGVGHVGAPGSFLAGFVTRLPSFPTHVRGHPPGLVLALWSLARIGLGGATAAALLAVAVAALAAPAALVAGRAVIGELHARAAAPFLALAPAAVWVATSDDAFFLGVATVGIAAAALATVRRGPASLGLAVAAGLLLGAGLMLSYGIAPLALVVAAVLLGRRRPWLALPVGAAVAAVLGCFALAGFSWIDGLRATRALDLAGVSQLRPYGVFLLVSPAALAVCLGPAAGAGLARLRGHGAWLLVGGALAAVALADLSGLSRGETERVWLPFAPWLLLATGALGVGARPSRGWLAAQVVLALALQSVVLSPW